MTDPNTPTVKVRGKEVWINMAAVGMLLATGVAGFSKVSSIEVEIARSATRIDTMARDISEIKRLAESQNSTATHRMDNLETRLDMLGERIANLEARVKILEGK